MDEALLRVIRLRTNEYFNRASGVGSRADNGSKGRNPGILSAVGKAEGVRVLSLDIFDEIDSFWGIGPEHVSSALREAGSVDQIDVRLNSPGGNVFDGIAIYNLLKGHSAPVNVDVVGLAASMASVVAMAGDTVRVSQGAWMMVHACSGLCWGNSDDMLATAGVLEGLTGEISQIYQGRSGASAEAVNQWISDETWFNGEQAVEAGLADTVGESAAAEAVGSIPLSDYGYTHVPDALVGVKEVRSEAKAERDPAPRFENRKRELRLLELETRI